MATALEILDRLDRATAELHAAAKQASTLARAMVISAGARAADDDDWSRIPVAPARCPVSGWSRSTLYSHIKDGSIRAKRIDGMRYYSAKDVREFLQKS